MNSVPEIRREKIFIPPEMTPKEIREKYGLSSGRSRQVKKQGFFVKNYSKKQIIIDPENFDPAVSYSTAKRVYFKNFSLNKVAQSIKDDLIQEAVTRMYELSGKVKERANEKYGIGYAYFYVAHNAMLAFLKSWQRHTRSRIPGDISDKEVLTKIYKSKKEMLIS
ncbi:MAG: hypothetical protein ACLQGU_08315 [bacterium]